MHEISYNSITIFIILCTLPNKKNYLVELEIAYLYMENFVVSNLFK